MLDVYEENGVPTHTLCPQPSTWSWRGAAATFWARLTHSKRELVLVRATAILNAIYDPVDPTTNQTVGSHCGVGMGCSSVYMCQLQKLRPSWGPGHPKNMVPFPRSLHFS